jgi:hypothetical protein
MKKLLLTLAVLCTLGLTAAKADYFVGYDDDGCRVFYSNYAGFYRYCYDNAPVYFGWNFGGYGWDYWRFNRGNFHGHRNWHGQNWQGGHGNWHGGGRGGFHGGHGGGMHGGHQGGHGGHGGH